MWDTSVKEEEVKGWNWGFKKERKYGKGDGGV